MIFVRIRYDKTVSVIYQRKCECWKNYLLVLEKIGLKRLIKSGGFGEIIHISLHSFPKESELGQGEISCLRLVDEHRNIHFILMIAKTKVRPKSFDSIPRLEFGAVVLAVKTSALIKKMLEIICGQKANLFWSILSMIPEPFLSHLQHTECKQVKNTAV